MSPGCIVVVFLAVVPVADAASHPSLTVDCLVKMSKDELESLYRAAPPAPLLDGYYPGKCVRMPRLTGLAWKGKKFSAADCSIINRWCLGIMAIKAHVYPGESWLDGKPSLIMDYRGTSKVWSKVRDELREVAPGLYLGIMYKEKKCSPQFATFFVLECCEK